MVTGATSSQALGDGNGVALTSGASEIVNGTAGDNTLQVENSTVAGDGGYDTYLYGPDDGAVTIENGVASANTAAGRVDFAIGLTDETLWFKQSGNNLLIDVLGTKDTLTVANWYAPAETYAQLAQFDAGSLELTTGFKNLVQAMASFGAENPAFNPQAVGAVMPTDTTLQSAIALAWHH